MLYQTGEKWFFWTESVKYREFFVGKSIRYIVSIHSEAAHFEFFTGQSWQDTHKGVYSSVLRPRFIANSKER